MEQSVFGKYGVGVSVRGSSEPAALCVCTGLANAVNATTVLSRCFPGFPGRARFWKLDNRDREITVDVDTLGFSREELDAVSKALDTIGRHYQ